MSENKITLYTAADYKQFEQALSSLESMPLQHDLKQKAAKGSIYKKLSKAILQSRRNKNDQVLVPHLFRAIYFNCLKTVQYLINSGVSVNSQFMQEGYAEENALHYVVGLNKKDEMLKQLCSKNNKPDFNIKNINGQSPIIKAILKDRLDYVKILLENGAKVSEIVASDCNTIHYVVYNQRIEALKVLLNTAQSDDLYLALATNNETEPPLEVAKFLKNSNKTNEKAYKKIITILEKKINELNKKNKNLKKKKTSKTNKNFKLKNKNSNKKINKNKANDQNDSSELFDSKGKVHKNIRIDKFTNQHDKQNNSLLKFDFENDKNAFSDNAKRYSLIACLFAIFGSAVPLATILGLGLTLGALNPLALAFVIGGPIFVIGLLFTGYFIYNGFYSNSSFETLTDHPYVAPEANYKQMDSEIVLQNAPQFYHSLTIINSEISKNDLQTLARKSLPLIIKI